MKKVVFLFVVVSFIVLAFLFFSKTTSKSLSVVAAANMKSVLDSMLVDFKKEHPLVNIEITYGASGKLYEQIRNGAPFDVFLSADMDLPLQLQKENFVLSEVKPYAIGQMVLWSSTINVEKRGVECLKDVEIKKIAIANPAAAPYGKRAVESMQYYTLYNELESKLVYGENITQTAQFVNSGAAQIAFLPLSIALSSAMKKEGGNYFLIPSTTHHSLQQGMIILKHAKDNDDASLFYNYMLSSSAQSILQQNGYLKP